MLHKTSEKTLMNLEICLGTTVEFMFGSYYIYTIKKKEELQMHSVI